MANTISKKLSIQVGLNGLSFCILDTSSNEFTHFHNVTFDSKLTPFDVLNALKAELSATTAFSDDFNSVLIIHHNELSTLVPSKLYNESNNADYLKFNSKILRTDFIANDTIETIDAVNVYIPYININNYIFETFGSFTYKHASSILIENTIKYLDSETVSMLINVHSKSIEVVVTKNEKLQHYNSFEYSTTEDFLYYVLFVIEQLNLNPETLNVKLTGGISKESELFEALYKYIRHVDLLDCECEYNSEAISEFALPKNFIILNSF